MFNLEQGHSAFPFPSTFTWTHNGLVITQNVTSRSVFGYPSLHLHVIELSDAGNYTLTATNYPLGNSTVVNAVGTSTGHFSLNVLCKCHFFKMLCPLHVLLLSARVLN